jgi:hypothetical protein
VIHPQLGQRHSSHFPLAVQVQWPSRQSGQSQKSFSDIFLEPVEQANENPRGINISESVSPIPAANKNQGLALNDFYVEEITQNMVAQ